MRDSSFGFQFLASRLREADMSIIITPVPIPFSTARKVLREYLKQLIQFFRPASAFGDHHGPLRYIEQEDKIGVLREPTEAIPGTLIRDMGRLHFDSARIYF